MDFLPALFSTHILLCDYYYTKFQPGNRWPILHFIVGKPAANNYDVWQQHLMSVRPALSYLFSCKTNSNVFITRCMLALLNYESSQRWEVQVWVLRKSSIISSKWLVYQNHQVRFYFCQLSALHLCFFEFPFCFWKFYKSEFWNFTYNTCLLCSSFR